MIEALRFVKGAVAKKDFVPALTHFKIKDGRILGYNGRISLSSPIDLDVEAYPKAVPFTKAIESCGDNVTMNLTATGRLSVKSGRFRAVVDCAVEDYPEFEPEGEMVPLGEGFTTALKSLVPLIGDDASRPWATGVLLRGESAFATNNIVLAEYWIGSHFPYELNIPGKTIRELIRLKEVPYAVQVAEESITFHFEGERWLRTQLKDTGWPDLTKVLSREASVSQIPEGFYEAVETVLPFTDKLERVYFHSGGVSSVPQGADSEGAYVEVDGLPGDGCYNAKYLLALKSLASHIDFTTYPNPCIFYGDRVRGAIIGMRPE